MPSLAKQDVDPLAAIQRLPDPAQLDLAAAPAHRERLRQLRALLHSFEPSGHELAELCGVAALHPDPWVRREVLLALPQWRAIGGDEIAEAVAWAIHDTDDFVAFAAITLTGELRLRALLPQLLMIVGRASERLRRQAGKPVGMGHALVLRAITDVAGTSDPDELAKIERTLFAGDHPFPSNFPAPGTARERTARAADRNDLVRVSRGR